MARAALKVKQCKMYEKRFVKEKNLQNLQSIIIDVDFVEDLRLMLGDF